MGNPLARYARSTFRAPIAALVVVTMSFVATVSGVSTSNAASGRSAPSECHDTQLTLAAESWSGAGGSDGFTVLIANHSKSTCSLKGYPVISFYTSTDYNIRVTVRHAGSMLYATVVPHVVNLQPKSVASFAVSFDGAHIPKSDPPSRCYATTMAVVAPAIDHDDGFFVPVGFDLCWSGWNVGLTPIQSGAQVKMQ